MVIYRYKTDAEWQKFLDSIKNLQGNERQKAIQDYITSNGKVVTLQEYFSDSKRNDNVYWDSLNQKWMDLDYAYRCYGEAHNCLERLAFDEMVYDNDLYYCGVVKNSPEDLCESRTDWADMKEYADGLVRFINDLKDEISDGKIIAK